MDNNTIIMRHLRFSLRTIKEIEANVAEMNFKVSGIQSISKARQIDYIDNAFNQSYKQWLAQAEMDLISHRENVERYTQFLFQNPAGNPPSSD